MAFLKTILIILLGYYLLKILARLFAPKIINYAAKKTESHFKQAFEGFEPEKVGEYIDFEELD